jgi:hypothetical protein
MYLIHLLLLLIQGFVPQEYARTQEIEAGFYAWKNKQKELGEASKFNKIMELESHWLVLIAFAFIFPFAKRAIDKSLNNDNSSEELKAKILAELQS